MKKLLAVLLGFLFISACAAAKPAPTPKELTVDPSEAREDCFELAGGQVLSYGFNSSGPVDFHIHYHEDGSMIYSIRTDNTTEGKGTFKAEKSQIYCLMWTNSGIRPVTLRYWAQPGVR